MVMFVFTETMRKMLKFKLYMVCKSEFSNTLYMELHLMRLCLWQKKKIDLAGYEIDGRRRFGERML